MSSKTLTRTTLSEAVYRELGLSRAESAELVESVLGHVCDALVKGEQVKISTFGTFNILNKTKRMGRNPKTGLEAAIAPRRVISSRPSKVMKDSVDAGNK